MHWVVNSKRFDALEGAGLIEPEKIVFGDYGSSYVAAGNFGDGKAQISFGFHVDIDARVHTSSSGGSSTNGCLSGPSGAGTRSADKNRAGGYRVSSGLGVIYGVADMSATDFDGGETCVSDGPTASAFIS